MNPSIVLGASRPDFLHEVETLADIFRMSAKIFFRGILRLFLEIQSVTYAELTTAGATPWLITLCQSGIMFPATRSVFGGRAGWSCTCAIVGHCKSGCVRYVPLDREMPAERVETVLTEVGAKGYISQDKLDS